MPATINADNGVVSGSAGVKTTADTSGELALQSNGATGLTLNTSLNVGIGTTSPATKLHIVDALSGGQLLVANNQTNSVIKYGTFATQHYTNAEEPALCIAMESAATENNVLIGGALGEFNAATSIKFYTASNNTTTTGSERMRIDSAGSVGIGVSPTQKLDVDGTILSRASGGEGGQLSLNNPDNVAVGLIVDVSAANTGRIFQNQNNSTLQIGQLAGTGGIVTFSTAAAERMRIASTGAIGLSGANYGTSGQVLTSAGSGAAPAWADAAAPTAGKLLTSGNINSSTGTVTLTWATTGVKRIRVFLAGASANNSGQIYIQVGHTTSVVSSNNYRFSGQMIQSTSITAYSQTTQSQWMVTGGSTQWPVNMAAEIGLGSDGRPCCFATATMTSEPRWFQMGGDFSTTWTTPQFQSVRVWFDGSATYSGRVTVVGYTE